MSITAVKAILSLSGSSLIIGKYLDYCFNAILYQRDILPSDEFQSVQQYGMRLFRTKNAAVLRYLQSTLAEVLTFIERKDIDQVTLAVTNAETLEVLEYWDFEVRNATQQTKSGVSAIQAEIRTVLKQITSCSTFMPLLEEQKCAFSVQVHAARQDMVWPSHWTPANRVKIENPSSVNFRSFSTDVHMVCSMVTYRNPD